MNERLQHCISELKLGIDITALFSEEQDEMDFKEDLIDLKSQQQEIIEVLFEVVGRQRDLSNPEDGKVDDIHVKLQKAKAQLDSLIDHQAKVRNSYRTMRSPGAELSIENTLITFDTIIGKGGFGVVWKGTFKGHTVKYLI